MLEKDDFKFVGKKLFPFFGGDIRRVGTDILKKHYSDGFTLMPLDTPAIVLIKKEGLPLTQIDQWVGIENIIKSRELASLWENEWFIPAQEAFTLNGICWPIFEKEAMYWFWRELTLVNSFAEVFKTSGGQEIKLFLNEAIRPSLYYFRSDLHAVLLKRILGDKIKYINIPLTDEDKAEYLRLATQAIMFQGYRDDQKCFSPVIIKGKVVLAINPGEFQRFSHSIQKLSEKFPGQFVVVTIFPDINFANRKSEQYSVPVISPMQSNTINSDFANRLWDGYNQLYNSTKANFWGKIFSSLRFHFKYYCTLRWPVLASNFQAWFELWSRYSPKAVIVSSLPDSEAQLPAAAAKKLGIPTVSLPHGGFGTRDESSKSDYVLYNSLPSKTVFERSGTPPDCLKPCRAILDVNEYKTVSDEIASTDQAWRLLILPGNMLHTECVFPVACPVSHINALETLAYPPEDIEGKISMKIKPHPGYPESELFPAVNMKLARKVCPPNIDLLKLVEQTDLVIALNYSRTALIHALRAGKPVIFFWTDPLIINRVDPNTYAGLLLPAGILAHTAKELWDNVKRFFTNTEFAEKLRSKAQKFARENLDDSNFPDIGEVIDQMLLNTGPPYAKNHDKQQAGVKKCEISHLIPDYAAIPITISDYPCDYGEMLLEELEVICKIANIKQPRNVFEIGTFMGKTTLCLAANTQATIYTLDLPPIDHPDFVKPRMNDPELDVYPEQPGIKFQKTAYSQRIHQLYGDSQSYDFSPFYEKMDFVFVDACHHYEFALRDSMNAFKMLRLGGIIVWHDYAEWAPGVMRALKEVSQRFSLFNITGTSLAVYRDNRILDTPCGTTSLQSELLERIGQSPGNVDALVDLAVMAAEKNSKDALAFLQDVLILDPGNERALALKKSIAKGRKRDDWPVGLSKRAIL